MRAGGVSGALVALAVTALLSAQSPAPAALVRVVEARVPVRAEANAKSTPLASVGYGQVLSRVQTAGAWTEVTVFVGAARIEGYVPTTALVPAPPEAAVSAAATVAEGFVLTEQGTAPAVALDARGRKTQWITAVPTRAVPVLEPVTDLSTLAASPALQTALEGGTVLPGEKNTPVVWCWLIPSADITTVSPADPALTILYNDVPGLPPGEALPAIVRLEAAGPRWRLAAIARGRADAPLQSAADWPLAAALRQGVTPDLQPEGAPGLMKTRLVHALPPGDYAVVLRPAGLKPVAGDRVFSGLNLSVGESVIYGEVWPFRVS